jgi:hypothetical protein
VRLAAAALSSTPITTTVLSVTGSGVSVGCQGLLWRPRATTSLARSPRPERGREKEKVKERKRKREKEREKKKERKRKRER